MGTRAAGTGPGGPPRPTYAWAGVDVEASRRAIERFREHVKSTARPEVIGEIGAFGGMFALDPGRYRKPVLVSGTDGVGTKVLIAQQMNLHDTIGIDLVAMSANDVAVMGAEPLFFLDYILIEKVNEETLSSIVAGIAAGCLQAGCALIGGEVAEHPGHLSPGSYDLAGFCVGVVEWDRIIDGSNIRPDDVVIGVASSGLHSNGFSLVRKVMFEMLGHKLDDRLPGLAGTLGEELLKPTLIYAPLVSSLMAEVPVKGLAHITQGGLPENLGRILPADVQAVLERTTWEVPKIFRLIESLGGVDPEEMFATFNMGIGLAVVVEAPAANRALDLIRSEGHRAFEIGVAAAAPGGDRRRVRLE